MLDAPVIRGVYVWDDVIGTITASGSIGEIYAGGGVCPTAVISAPSIGLVAEYDRSVFTDDPRLPVAEIGELVSGTRDAYTELLRMNDRLDQAQVELQAIVTATAADVQSVLNQAETRLADAQVEAQAILADIQTQGRLAFDAAQMGADQAFSEVNVALEAGRLEALDSAVDLKEEVQKTLEAAQGEAEARLKQGQDDAAFIKAEAALVKQRFETTQSAQLQRLDALAAT